MMLHFEKQLLKRRALGNLRQLQVGAPPIDFSSNDYLGLARSSELAAEALEEYSRHRGGVLSGLCSTGSRLLTGNSIYAQNLEERIAAFHGYEAGVLFNCGYMANVGLLSAVAHQDSVIFFDAGIHASTHDGILLSRAKALPFRHNAMQHLESRLQNCSSRGDRFICVESIYSTDGTEAPLPHLCQLAQQYGAHLIVDEAHAGGACGPEGRGLVAKHHLTEHIFAQITTFGKAIGTSGAIVLGSSLLKQALINFARSYIYTTAPALQTLAAIKCSYDRFPKMQAERDHLQKLIQLFPNSSRTHIQSISIQGNAAAKRLCQELAHLGFDVRALLSPTVRRGHEVLRICLHAFNTENQLAQLLNLCIE